MLAVAETIKELLKLKNISQVELAEKLGMSKQNINNKFILRHIINNNCFYDIIYTKN